MPIAKKKRMACAMGENAAHPFSLSTAKMQAVNNSYTPTHVAEIDGDFGA